MTRDDAILLAAAAGVAGLFVATELRIAGEVGLPLDDSWIHLRFAQNLAAGRGFAFNPGEPVAGSTAPLWTLCLAAAVALGLPGLVAAKALGFLAYAATALVTGRLAAALGLSRGIAVAAGLPGDLPRVVSGARHSHGPLPANHLGPAPGAGRGRPEDDGDIRDRMEQVGPGSAAVPRLRGGRVLTV